MDRTHTLEERILTITMIAPWVSLGEKDISIKSVLSAPKSATTQKSVLQKTEASLMSGQQSNHHREPKGLHRTSATSVATLPARRGSKGSRISKSRANTATPSALRSCLDHKEPSRRFSGQVPTEEAQEFSKRVEESTQAVMNRIFGQTPSFVMEPSRKMEPLIGNQSDERVGDTTSSPCAPRTIGVSDNDCTVLPGLDHPLRNLPKTMAIISARSTAKSMEDTARTPLAFANRVKKATTTIAQHSRPLDSQPHTVKAIVAQLNGVSIPSRSSTRTDRENAPIGPQRAKAAVMKESHHGSAKGVLSDAPNLYKSHVRPHSSNISDSSAGISDTLNVLAPGRRSPTMDALTTPMKEDSLKEQDPYHGDFNEDEDDGCSFIELVRVPTPVSIRSRFKGSAKIASRRAILRPRSPLSSDAKHEKHPQLRDDSDDDNDEPLQYLDVGPPYGRNAWSQGPEEGLTL